MGKRHIPKNLRRKGKKKSAAAAVAALVVCLVLLVLFVPMVGTVFGRYQRQIRSDGWVKAYDFYFTSNLLDGGTHTLAPGSKEVTFTLSNHADELRYSEVDINYEVKVTDKSGDPVVVTITSYNEGTVPGDTGTLKMNQKSDAEVTISGLQAGTYTVTATGDGGYKKTLTAEIKVLPEDAKLYWNTENVSDGYTLLTVWNEGDTSGNVTIEYTGIPDNTNPNMEGWKTNGQKEDIKIEPHESKVFRFFGETVTVKKVTGAEKKSFN